MHACVNTCVCLCVCVCVFAYMHLRSFVCEPFCLACGYAYVGACVQMNKCMCQYV